MARDNADGLFAISYELTRFITQGQIEVADVPVAGRQTAPGLVGLAVRHFCFGATRRAFVFGGP
jgi:hypothetical protein